MRICEKEGCAFGPAEIALMNDAYARASAKLKRFVGEDEIVLTVQRQIATCVIDDVRDGLADAGYIADRAAHKVAGRLGYLSGKAIPIEIGGKEQSFLDEAVRAWRS